ncbi:hypothetical protein HO173_001582 [Letharia columbiana]|uniref:Uncharacterized protein n=1 Tax=Letharia columbiana TaxID=112416 RepID=A0A8H6G3N0_9LECA|nr:uncharacterized protein HO173_001582 [Letharia columbiana]KAF6239974.1 hypothetical protein HO173_001582 [Letharia columbiana]
MSTNPLGDLAAVAQLPRPNLRRQFYTYEQSTIEGLVQSGDYRTIIVIFYLTFSRSVSNSDVFLVFSAYQTTTTSASGNGDCVTVQGLPITLPSQYPLTSPPAVDDGALQYNATTSLVDFLGFTSRTPESAQAEETRKHELHADEQRYEFAEETILRCRTEIMIMEHSQKADLARSNARIETCRAFEKSSKRASTSTDSRHSPPIAARPFPMPGSTQSWTQTCQRTVTDRRVGAIFLEKADDCHRWERSPHRIFCDGDGAGW